MSKLRSFWIEKLKEARHKDDNAFFLTPRECAQIARLLEDKK